MQLPLRPISFSLPSAAGRFGAVRKHDIHTGIDLYCPPGTTVRAMEDGLVMDRGLFTGAKAYSPWWNNTAYIAVKGNSGTILYGELNTDCLNDKHCWIREGQEIGRVATVLKANKGLPMTMLHLEGYHRWPGEAVEWKLGEPCHKMLFDPMELLLPAMHNSFSIDFSPENVTLPPDAKITRSESNGVTTLDISEYDPSLALTRIGDSLEVDEQAFLVIGVSKQTTHKTLRFFLKKAEVTLC